ncbi:hypothetical protein S100892_00038 (plasmid) [Pediococcus pentosaceus]|uniref:Uncharacterized protein n=1 Tax=Pediococcus pentosaceus TaxID=1255 RepID=A0A1Y0VMF2_PEDPE|nr:hypothetical protein S100892_00038 [Pediococcus pentosaceus]
MTTPFARDPVSSPCPTNMCPSRATQPSSLQRHGHTGVNTQKLRQFRINKNRAIYLIASDPPYYSINLVVAVILKDELAPLLLCVQVLLERLSHHVRVALARGLCFLRTCLVSFEDYLKIRQNNQL